MSLLFPSDFLYEFSTLIVVLDPLSTVPVYMAVTQDLQRKDALKVGLYALGIGFLILLFFIIFGQIFLNALDVPLASFQLAGSIVLFLIGLDMIKGKLVEPVDLAGKNRSLIQRAAYPLAMPIIAGSGSILTVVMLTNNDTRSISEQFQTTFILLLCLSFHFVSFSLSGYIKKYIGSTGIETIGRVFGLILTTLAVTGIILALKISFNLPHGG